MRKIIKDKKGVNLITENIIFIILNLIFLTILVVFVFRQGNGIVISEQNLAKKIALTIDAARPGMTVFLDLSKEINLAEENGISKEEVVSITGNIVHSKLHKNGGSDYSFFNDVSVNLVEENGDYTLVIEERLNSKEKNEISEG